MALPLHIFEDRYLQMVEECLNRTRQFGVVLAQPEAEEEFEGHSIGTTALITHVERLEDGHLDIVTAGVERFRVLDWTRSEPYAVARVEPIAAEYAGEGLVVVPAFEIIATVADARAGDDGNYSNETPVADIRPWIETAGEAGLYVLLDLQPGRSDFLSQARLYEEFLRLPYVGLALDPEWRLGPDQFHLQQFGSIPAEEVNAVAEWLAGLVREEHLPQKMLLLHQFRLSMIPDRDNIAVPGELALVIQMDGQGPIADKYATWAAVTAGTEGSGWFWGWKNFYDEDSPTATPAQVMDLEPAVVYVSYQ